MQLRWSEGMYDGSYKIIAFFYVIIQQIHYNLLKLSVYAWIMSRFFLTMLPHNATSNASQLLLLFFFVFFTWLMHYRTGTTTILTSYISLHVTIKRLTTAFRSIIPWTLRNFMSIGCHQKKFTYIGKTRLRNSTEESALRWAFENQWVSLLLSKPKSFFISTLAFNVLHQI